MFGVNCLPAEHRRVASAAVLAAGLGHVCFEDLRRTALGLMGGEDAEKMQIPFNHGAHTIVDDSVVRAPLGD
jgi:hypothetical protein